MRVAKAAGLIARIPGGRRAKDLPPLSKDRRVRRAQKFLEARMEKQELAARDQPPAQRPWAEMSKGEKLAAATDRALDVAKQYLDVPVDPGNLKLASVQQALALGVIGYQIKVESGVLAGGSNAAKGPTQVNVRFVPASGKELPPGNTDQAEHGPPELAAAAPTPEHPPAATDERTEPEATGEPPSAAEPVRLTPEERAAMEARLAQLEAQMARREADVDDDDDDEYDFAPTPQQDRPQPEPVRVQDQSGTSGRVRRSWR
jgi:hypothetical protein